MPASPALPRRSQKYSDGQQPRRGRVSYERKRLQKHRAHDIGFLSGSMIEVSGDEEMAFVARSVVATALLGMVPLITFLALYYLSR